jgi:hypothetical protein
MRGTEPAHDGSSGSRYKRGIPPFNRDRARLHGGKSTFPLTATAAGRKIRRHHRYRHYCIDFEIRIICRVIPGRGPLISGLPEISTLSTQVGNSRLGWAESPESSNHRRRLLDSGFAASRRPGMTSFTESINYAQYPSPRRWRRSASRDLDC